MIHRRLKRLVSRQLQLFREEIQWAPNEGMVGKYEGKKRNIPERYC
jgi:hypothetical protein